MFSDTEDEDNLPLTEVLKKTDPSRKVVALEKRCVTMQKTNKVETTQTAASAEKSEASAYKDYLANRNLSLKKVEKELASQPAKSRQPQQKRTHDTTVNEGRLALHKQLQEENAKLKRELEEMKTENAKYKKQQKEDFLASKRKETEIEKLNEEKRQLNQLLKSEKEKQQQHTLPFGTPEAFDMLPKIKEVNHFFHLKV